MRFELIGGGGRCRRRAGYARSSFSMRCEIDPSDCLAPAPKGAGRSFDFVVMLPTTPRRVENNSGGQRPQTRGARRAEYRAPASRLDRSPLSCTSGAAVPRVGCDSDWKRSAACRARVAEQPLQEATAAALRPARGVPRTGFASGSLPLTFIDRRGARFLSPASIGSPRCEPRREERHSRSNPPRETASRAPCSIDWQNDRRPRAASESQSIPFAATLPPAQAVRPTFAFAGAAPPFRTFCLRALAHGSGRSMPSRVASPAMARAKLAVGFSP